MSTSKRIMFQYLEKLDNGARSTANGYEGVVKVISDTKRYTIWVNPEGTHYGVRPSNQEPVANTKSEATKLPGFINVHGTEVKELLKSKYGGPATKKSGGSRGARKTAKALDTGITSRSTWSFENLARALLDEVKTRVHDSQGKINTAKVYDEIADYIRAKFARNHEFNTNTLTNAIHAIRGEGKNNNGEDRSTPFKKQTKVVTADRQAALKALVKEINDGVTGRYTQALIDNGLSAEEVQRATSYYFNHSAADTLTLIEMEDKDWAAYDLIDEVNRVVQGKTKVIKVKTTDARGRTVEEDKVVRVTARASSGARRTKADNDIDAPLIREILVKKSHLLPRVADRMGINDLRATFADKMGYPFVRTEH